jgi:hypothetical protein
MRASLDMRANRVAARVRSNNQLATKSGFALPKGGSIQSNGGPGRGSLAAFATGFMLQ